MIASRSKWEPYLGLVRSVSAAHGVPPELVLGIIQAESNFDPNAYRAEPQIGDASRGLMQLLLMTARGLGFSGDPSLLFDAATNVKLGTKLISMNLAARSGNVGKALSMYNGGYRPSLGFGEPLSDGRFKNQTYVDRVLGYRDEFAAALAPVAPPSSGGGVTVLPPSDDSSVGRIAVLVAGGIVLAGVVWALLRR